MAGTRKLTIEILGDARSAEAALLSVSTSADGLERALRAGALAFAGLAAGAAGALYKLGSDFDEVSDKLRIKTGATGTALKALEADFRAVAGSVPASFGDASEAIATLNQRLNLTGKPLQELATQFLNLSRITGTEVGPNVEKLTRFLGDAGVPANEMAGALDKLFVASQKSGVQFDVLAELAVKFGAPMRQLGFDLDSTVAMLAKFEKEGVNTELVMGSLRIALAKLAKGDAAAGGLSDLHDQFARLPASAESASAAMKEMKAAASAMALSQPEIAAALVDTIEKMKAAKDPAEQMAIAVDGMRKGAEEFGNAGLNMGQTFEALVERIKSAKDPTEAITDAITLFGRKAGPDMAAAIREGRLSIDDLKGAIAGSGDTIAKAAADTADGAEKMQVAFNNIKIAAQPLADAVFSFAGKGADFAGRWVQELTTAFQTAGWSGVWDAISAGLARGWRDAHVGDALKGFADRLTSEIIPDLTKALGEIPRAFGKWASDPQNLRNLTNALEPVAVEVGKFFLIELPIALGKAFVELNKSLAEGVKGLATGLGKLLVDGSGPLVEWVGDAAAKFPGQLAKWTAAFTAWVIGLPKDMGEAFAGLVSSLANAIFDAFKQMWDTAARAINRKIPFKDPIPTFGSGDSGGGPLDPSAVSGFGKLDDPLDVTANVSFKLATATLEAETQKVFDKFRPLLNVTPDVASEEVTKLAAKLTRNLNAALVSEPANWVKVIFDNDQVIAGARAAAKQAIDSASTNPPAKVQLAVDEDHATGAVAAATSKAVGAASANPPAKVQVAVDEEFHASAVSKSFQTAVGALNSLVDRARIHAEVDSDHLTADTAGKAAGAVHSTTAALVASGTTIKVETSVDPEKLKAQVMGAIASVGNVAINIGTNLFGGGPESFPENPKEGQVHSFKDGTTYVYRAGQWLPVEARLHSVDAGGATLAGDAVVITSGSGAYGSGRANGAPVEALPSAGTTVVIQTLIGELNVGGTMTRADAQRVAEQIYPALEQVARSRGQIRLDGSWRFQ